MTAGTLKSVFLTSLQKKLKLFVLISHFVIQPSVVFGQSLP